MEMLTVKQVALLKNCSLRLIQKEISDRNLRAIETKNDRNRKMYLIPLDTLDADLQLKWIQHNQPDTISPPVAAPSKDAEIDHFTSEERAEIDFWIVLVKRWMEYRMKPGVISKAEVDTSFVALCRLEYPDKNISTDTLYRKWRAIRLDDMEALVDKRGKWRKGKSDIDSKVWQAFLYFYLDESQHPIQKCIEYTKLWVQEKCPELYDTIPSYSSFYRRIQSDIQEGVKVLGREGEKAFTDRCTPYIRRIYDDLESNDWWIADNHTFDVFVKGKDGKLRRPYLTAFLDARSGIFTGYYITYAPSSNATLVALRKGILAFGIPENILVDNGREFLNFDVGGLGHRKKKTKAGAETFEPPGVFKRLGIKMTNALVRNAKAKIIERRFRDIKDQISRLFETYTGGNVIEKPERLKKVLKKDEIYTEDEFRDMIELLIEGYCNMELYNGKVAADKGKVKMDVFYENLKRQRIAPPEELNLMLMRSSRPQKVGRRGVHLDIGGARIDYWNDDFLNLMLDQKVYFRYDPDDLSSIRIYDLEDRFVMDVPADNTAVCSYNASKDDVKAAMQKTRKLGRLTREYKESIILQECDRTTALELVLAQAKRNQKEYDGKANPDILELQRAVEEPMYKKVVGGADLDTMNRNAAKKQGGK
jgi:hypothetical protein